ncbi:hypothetical protein O6H91_05G085300 [Diphasiastrum complanatum]|uniref:Uncharacterized protein n=1 Tax=Diphasiastrum complanatum TaxID=34168 RepID=A0ACC2DQE9_DIPCM|nr:hypothetical protein O6H91_05G085300 [Diphasiastrum complanatum]
MTTLPSWLDVNRGRSMMESRSGVDNIWDPFDECIDRIARGPLRYIGSVPLLQMVSSSALRHIAPSIRQYVRDVRAIANTRIDWFETPTSHVLKADLPGLTNEDIQVTVEDGRILQIRGEKEHSEVATRWHRTERSRSEFFRRIRLPPDIDTDRLQGEVVDGVLTITIPKLEANHAAANGLSNLEMSW